MVNFNGVGGSFDIYLLSQEVSGMSRCGVCLGVFIKEAGYFISSHCKVISSGSKSGTLNTALNELYRCWQDLYLVKIW